MPGMRGSGRAFRDCGEGAVSYVAVLLLIAGIVAVLPSANVGSAVTIGIKGALCRVLQQDNCADQPEATQRLPDSAPPIQAYRPQGQDSGGDCPVPRNEYGGCGPPTREDAAANQPPSHEGDDDECEATSGPFGPEFCSEFFEFDMGINQGTVYIYEEATDLINGLLRDICRRLPGGDEATGRCILAFLRNLQNIPDNRRGDWNDMTEGDRWEDIMDELDELEDGGGCLTVSKSRGPFGRTNWSTRDSGATHCQQGSDPLEEARRQGVPIDALPQMLPRSLTPDELRVILRGLPANMRGRLGDLVDLDAFIHDLEQELGD